MSNKNKTRVTMLSDELLHVSFSSTGDQQKVKSENPEEEVNINSKAESYSFWTQTSFFVQVQLQLNIFSNFGENRNDWKIGQNSWRNSLNNLSGRRLSHIIPIPRSTEIAPLCGLAESKKVAFSMNYGFTKQKVKHLKMHYNFNVWFLAERFWTQEDKIISSRTLQESRRELKIYQEPSGLCSFLKRFLKISFSFWPPGISIESSNYRSNVS